MQHSRLLAELKRRGYKVTPQRRAILQALCAFERPPSAREILENIRVAFPEISLDTVYRNLNLLAGAGLVHQINLQARESTRYEVGGSHHHHLVCLGCGESVCVTHCAMGKRELALAREKEFRVVSHAFEIYGYCKQCGSGGLVCHERG